MKAGFKFLDSFQDLESVFFSAPREIAVDVETVGKMANPYGLLGIAFGWRAQRRFIDQPKYETYYLCLNYWDEADSTIKKIKDFDRCLQLMKRELRKRELIGHNIEYDRKWVDACLGIKSAWKADTRIMWHLTNEEQLEFGYSLKTAMTKLLGWESANEHELEAAVKERGGKLSKGDHYLAPKDLLGKYAGLDILATLELYELLAPKLHEWRYWHFYRRTQAYNRLLSKCTENGVRTDIQELEKGIAYLEARVEECKDEIHRICKDQIETIEKRWMVEKINGYSHPRYVAKFIVDFKRHRRFNPSSPQQKATLFFDMLKIPVYEKTPSGRPKTDKATIASINHPSAKPFVELSENQKLLSMAKGYLESVQNGRIHFPYNICGTVTGRLGGFKPYALNMPFESEEVMRPFKVSPGYVGIHSDLKSVEPAFIAAFSKDPTLLKVHRDGLGDVYLDFAKVAFPDNVELQTEYKPYERCPDNVKSKFKRERNICKVVHLAVGYTGTAVTVAKTLNKAGIPTTRFQAQALVDKYWDLFHNVKDLSARCKQVVEKNGYIVNPYGRKLYVPKMFHKDSMNRLIQSSGHDALVDWIREIDKLRRTMLPSLRPVLIDTHDSTTWECPEGEYETAKRIFDMALGRVNARLGLCVTLSAETKPFHTFYGLKNSED